MRLTAVLLVATVVGACTRPTPLPGSGPDQEVPARPGGAEPDNPITIVTIADAVADVIRMLAPDAKVTALADGDPAAFIVGQNEQGRAAAADIVVARDADLIGLGVADLPRPGPGVAAAEGGLAVVLLGDDPYPWLDPTWVLDLAARLRLALTMLDPANAEEYEEAAVRLHLELSTLTDMENLSFAAIPDERMSFAVDAPEAVALLASRLGLTAVALTDGVQSVAQAEAMSDEDLAEAIASATAPMVYLAAPGNHARVAQLASASGRPIGLLFAVNPSADDGPAPGYLGMMRFNVRSLFEGLSPPDGAADGIPAAGTEESADSADADSTAAAAGTEEPTDPQVTPEDPAPATAPVPTLGAAGI